MSYRRLFVLALMVGLPGIAGAQFTTFIPPQPKVADSVKVVVAAATAAHADSVVNMQLTNMKTWVDSAAGLAATPVTPMTTADSLAVATTVAAADTSTTTMIDGMPAPETASALPLIALLGAVTLSMGMLLLARPKLARPKFARQRARQRE